MFFFFVAPFCSCPASLVSRKFFAVGPGCAKCFFLLRSVGRRDLSAGPEQKKKHHPGRFFFCSGPGERQGKEKPRWAPARGQSKKNTTQGVFFFAAAPAKSKGRRSPVGRRHGARAKKKHHPGCFFFCSGPGERQGKEKPRWAPARGQSKKFFFCSGPVPAPNGASPSPAFPRGRSKKKNTLCGVFFLLWPRAGAQRGFSFPRLSPGPQQKQKTPWVVFFFAAAPRGRSLTHCGPGWRCLPLAGWCFFFCCGPARTGVVFFFLLWPRPDAYSLTVGWGDFGKARVLFFFLLRPRRVFLDNNKKCLGYYIGSPGPQQKKKHHFQTAHSLTAGLGGDASPSPGRCFFFFAAAPRTGVVFSVVFFFCCGPARTLTHSRWAEAISARPGWCFFFAAAPPGLFRQ